MVSTVFKGKSTFFLLVLAASGLAGAVESPRIVAHRGNYQYDDNARGGFQQSLDAGVTGFETDVQMTSDGGFVIMHDSTVATTTTGSGDVKALSFAAVTNLTLKKSGELFADAANGDYTLINAPDGFEQIPFGEIGRY